MMKGNKMGVGIALGIGVGVAIETSLGNVAFGAALNAKDKSKKQ